MLRKSSLLFWCTLVVPAAIIAIGINFIFNPVGASAGFGIPIHDPAAFPFMWIKGIRDIFAGLAIVLFLLKGDRRTTATALRHFDLRPVRRWVGDSETSGLRATYLYSLGHGALHDDRHRLPSPEAEHQGGIVRLIVLRVLRGGKSWPLHPSDRRSDRRSPRPDSPVFSE